MKEVNHLLDIIGNTIHNFGLYDATMYVIDFALIIAVSIAVLTLTKVGHKFWESTLGKLGVTSPAVKYVFPNIQNEFTDREKLRMAVSEEDVRWYLKEVAKKDPDYIKGITDVILCDRTENLPERILASYTPDKKKKNKGVIRIFPLEYNKARQGFTFSLFDNNTLFAGYTHESARRLQLFCLGHEISHHVIYKKTKQLHGGDIEQRCDQFSLDLDIKGIGNPEEDGSGKVYSYMSPAKRIGDM